jgi:H+/Cl- antiporter ClcA
MDRAGSNMSLFDHIFYIFFGVVHIALAYVMYCLFQKERGYYRRLCITLAAFNTIMGFVYLGVGFYA